VELCDDVGLRLHARCRTFVLVHESKVQCPRCGRVFAVAPDGTSPCPADGCSWSTTLRSYLDSVRNHYAFPGRAMDAFASFHRRYPGARSYTDKILLIDQLIHSFHVDERTETSTKSVASKLLEGNKNDVVKFLSGLSAVDSRAKDHWRRTLSRTIHGHVLDRGPDEE